MDLLIIIVAIAVSYLAGAVPTGYIIARFLKGIDLREYGSGNIGATNLMRVVGKVPGLFALLLDIIKGTIAVALFAPMFYRSSIVVSEPFFKITLGLCAVSGHIWTIFLRFKGGKGVATTIGVFLGLAPLVTALALLFWLVIFSIFRYVSLASLVMAVSLPILMVIFGKPTEYIILSAILCCLIGYRHKSNIVRVMKGTEHKL